MTVYSAFLSIDLAAYPDDTPYPEVASVLDRFRASSRYNVLYYRSEQIEIDNAGTRALNMLTATQSSENKLLVCRVIGNVKATITSLDASSATITMAMEAYGTAKYPGLLVLTSDNVSDITFTGLADDTVVEAFLAITCPDSDSRLDTLA